MIVTEKIDGTNAAVGIKLIDDAGAYKASRSALVSTPVPGGNGITFAVYAQSRKRLISPMDDNFGFARWVWENAEELANTLGPGLHFGEWWGEGIQRGYGIDGKRFSLFNTHRWGWMLGDSFKGQGIFTQLSCVPVIGAFGVSLPVAQEVLFDVGKHGSYAVPGFMNPEGICLYLPDVGKTYKMTFDGDQPKGMAA